MTQLSELATTLRIVHPDEVIKYIRPDEAQISYNPLFMALCWEALSTYEVMPNEAQRPSCHIAEHSREQRHRPRLTDIVGMLRQQP